MIKSTPFGLRQSGAERIDLQFRAEFFNLFNIVTMGLPSNILNGSGFGEISKTAGNSRQIQFSLKMIYWALCARRADLSRSMASIRLSSDPLHCRRPMRLI